MKCSNGGSDMCPKRHVVNGHLVSWGEGTVPLGAAAAGRPLPPSLPSICFEPKANCRRQRQSSSKREATFNLSSSLFHHSGFLMTGGRKQVKERGREGEKAHSAGPSSDRELVRPGRSRSAHIRRRCFSLDSLLVGRVASRGQSNLRCSEGEKRGAEIKDKRKREGEGERCNSIILNES